jgi:hypothetical protein
MPPRRLAILSLATLTLAGCATGPKLSESTVPPVAAGKGRVYFYRTQVVGFGVQPSILLNGDKVGDCTPNGVFYKDVAPGDYEASTATEVEHKLTFAVAAGDEKYVRCYISIGIVIGHGNLELVAPEEAKPDIASLSLTGGQ